MKIAIAVALSIGAFGLFGFLQPKKPSLVKIADDFTTGYEQLQVPGFTYDYREYFAAVPDNANLTKQETFFQQQQTLLREILVDDLTPEETLYHKHLLYESAHNLERIALERDWVAHGRPMPVAGLSTLPNHKQWYAHFVKQYCSITIAPETVFELGVKEMARVKAEIDRIQISLGFADSTAFYNHLQSDTFYLTDKADVLKAYTVIDSSVREHLNRFVPVKNIPPIYPMEWPDATAYTPPGMYLNRQHNAYGKDVFQYNYHNGRHNKRAMEWLYLHEAIPGHHLQFTVRVGQQATPRFQQLFMYPANFEGWACYVEYFGKDLGLYQDTYSYLGKWEWDMVRSARLCIDVGTHYYGWDRQQALDFWHRHLPWQADIADREVTRVTNWPGQCLSYKVGADFIEKLAAKHGTLNGRAAFHERYLRYSYFPLEVIAGEFGI